MFVFGTAGCFKMYEVDVFVVECIKGGSFRGERYIHANDVGYVSLKAD